MKRFFKAFVSLLALALMLGSLFACSKKPAESNDSVIASIGDRKLTLGFFKSAFTSYADYYSQMGMDPFASKTDLEYFQDTVLDAVVNDLIVLHRADEEGFALSSAQISEAEQAAEQELEEIKSQLMSQAEQLNASDPSMTAEQHFEGLIRELSEYYTGMAMSFEDYSAEYKKQTIDTAIVSAYRSEFEAKLPVGDSEVLEWYEEQLQYDQKMYAEDPGKYMENALEFEIRGEQYTDVYPPTVIPEGYSRIFDIVVYPDGELSEEYESLIEEMESVAAQCSDMLFSDALNGTSDHADEIAEFVSAYKVLEARANEMYDEYRASAVKKMDQAYACLTDGESFQEVMKRFSERSYSDAENGDIPSRILENGELISITHDCGDSDWSSVIKDIYSMTAVGEYSTVFSDDDGSLHIIMRGENVPSGSVDVASIKDAIIRIIRAEKSASAWKNKLSEWREDPALHIDMDTVRSIGTDKLPKED